MTAAADNVVSLTGNPLIDGLTWGAAWQFGGGAQVLTYSLSLNDNPNGGAWNATLSDAVRAALAAWSNVANISFVESGSGTAFNLSTADLAFILTGNELPTNAPGVVGLGLPPSPSFANSLLGGNRSAYPQPEGDIALDNYYSGFGYTSPGGIGLTLLLHEIGHALGLKHTDSTYDGRPSFGSLGIANLDSNLYTVMSYTDPSGSQMGTSLGSGNAATPMPLDILAIQEIYGANLSFNTGDNVYTLDSSAVVQTLWDAGGTDTLSAASSSSPVTIDLRPGHYSQVNGSQGRLGIAYNVSIENALGGPSIDYLIGNGGPNILDGGGFPDTLEGGGGNDTLLGGTGEDNDTAKFSGLMADYVIAGDENSITVSDGQAGRDGSDALSGIEYLSFSDGKLEVSIAEDGLFGPAVFVAGAKGVPEEDNRIVAGDGNQVLSGWWGADTLTGGAGRDVFTYFTYKDSMVSTMDTITDFTSGSDVITFDGMGGVPLRSSPYAYQGSVAATIDAIRGDGAISNAIVFFSDGADGYVYVKGNGYSTSNLDGSLIRLLGHVQALTDADIVNSNVPAPPAPTVVLSPLNADHAEGNSGSIPFTFLLTRSGHIESSSTVNWRTYDGSPYIDSFFITSTSDWPTPYPNSWPSGSVSFAPGESSKEIAIYLNGDTDAEFDEAFTVRLVGGANHQIAGGGAVARGVVRNDDASAGNNSLTGTGGNDVFSGGAGNDTLNGGYGLDVAVFSGAKVGYTITKSGKAYVVTDIDSANGDDGTDTLSGVERIQFADAEVGVPAGSGMRVGHVAYPANWLEYYTVADFNGDGKTDISWLTKGGIAGIWTIDGENTWNPATMDSPFTGWTTVDNNGDGLADVALQHTAAGGTIQWNALVIAMSTAPAMPLVPEFAPPPILPPVVPVGPPVIPPPPPPPDWGM